ncbi:MAG: TetR family transcriptional regulator [Dehalococcoidia bacterium]|nr:TetR family transcriptional regulator [Dehalococcoidia bacterium]
MMNSPTTTRRSGRRSGESGTREAILEAARAQFIASGFRGTTIRSVAKAAGVDPALVLHFFRNKDALFAEAVRPPINPATLLQEALERSPDSAGAALVEFLLDAWDSEDTNRTMLAIVRSAMTEEVAARMVREQIVSSVAETLGACGIDRPEYRAALVATQMAGIAIGRYVVGFRALVEADRGEMLAAFGPTIQRYLTGDLQQEAEA